MKKPAGTLAYGVVALGVLSASLASIFFKFATAEPLVVAFYRLAFSALLLAIPALTQRGAGLDAKHIGLSVASGAFLALHFATWFLSLDLTSVASSTILVSTHPFFVLLYEYMAGGKRTQGWSLAGVLLALVGVTLVSWGDLRLDLPALKGDMLAIAGAVTVSGYFMIGRYVRQRVDAITYSAVAYSSAAAMLLAAAVMAGNRLTGFEPVNWWVFGALALFPTIFGHTLFNWALRYISPAVVSVTILGEPIGASILAWMIWGAIPTVAGIIGGVLVLSGIALFQWHQSRT